jgi:hypothetical protein
MIAADDGLLFHAPREAPALKHLMSAIGDEALRGGGR